jgi:hypothetical protein
MDPGGEMKHPDITPLDALQLAEFYGERSEEVAKNDYLPVTAPATAYWYARHATSWAAAFLRVDSSYSKEWTEIEQAYDEDARRASFAKRKEAA